MKNTAAVGMMMLVAFGFAITFTEISDLREENKAELALLHSIAGQNKSFDAEVKSEIIYQTQRAESEAGTVAVTMDKLIDVIANLQHYR